MRQALRTPRARISETAKKAAGRGVRVQISCLASCRAGSASGKSAKSASKRSGAAAETAPVASWTALQANRAIVSLPVFCSLLRTLQQQRQVVLRLQSSSMCGEFCNLLQPRRDVMQANLLSDGFLHDRTAQVACEPDNFAAYDRRTVHHPIFGFGVWQPSLCQAYSHS